jgi:hypothetical protein
MSGPRNFPFSLGGQAQYWYEASPTCRRHSLCTRLSRFLALASSPSQVHVKKFFLFLLDSIRYMRLFSICRRNCKIRISFLDSKWCTISSHFECNTLKIMFSHRNSTHVWTSYGLVWMSTDNMQYFKNRLFDLRATFSSLYKRLVEHNFSKDWWHYFQRTKSLYHHVLRERV